jgi:hypothetical protein
VRCGVVALVCRTGMDLVLRGFGGLGGKFFWFLNFLL